MKRKRNQIPLATVFLMLIVIRASATVFYVKAGNGSPAPPYSTWSTAAATIQDAVDLSSDGDSILVTNGTYSTGGRAVYGIATNRVAVDRPVTVQSVNGPLVTIIQGVPGPANSVVRCVYLTNGAALIGFTLKSGCSRSGGDFFHEQCGGGVWCESVNAMVSNCTLTNNNAYGGGGGTYSGTLTNCVLSGNHALEGGGGYFADLNNCVLSGNSATYGAGAYYGALNNCSLSGNSAHDPTGKRTGDGGGAYFGSVTNCSLTGNSARVGGGGAAWGNLANCLVANNTALQGGGTSGSTLVNCTVVGNSAPTDGQPGGGVDGGILGSTALNSIILFNTSTYGNANYDYNFGSGGALLSNCCTAPIPSTGTGNIAVDPALVNYAGGDYHLSSNSPCINSGINIFISGANDLDGNARIAGGTVDMGAFEYQTPTSVISYAWLQQYGLPTDGSADYADTNHTGMNNWQKWVAGLDPTDPASLLRIASVVPTNDPPGMVVTWQSVTSRNYYLQRSSALAAGPAFSLIQSNLPGQSGTTSYTDATATNSGPYFYRVGVQ